MRKKIALIGAGNIGGVLAQLITQKELVYLLLQHWKELKNLNNPESFRVIMQK